jgi:alkaline phosphatase D
MANVTRRGLLGSAGVGAISLSGCGTLDRMRRGDAIADAKVSFQHGVASGDPLPDRVILWTRVTPLEDFGGKLSVKWDVRGEDGVVAASGTARTSASRDWTVKVDASGLTAGTRYSYQFRVGDQASPTGQTQTASTTTERVSFGVVSCSNWQFGRFNAYRALSEERGLDAIIHLGDYLYEYGVDGYGGEVGSTIGRTHEPIMEIVTLGDYRTRHAQYKTDPDLQAAHAAAPWICTWDDHESANDSYRTGAENHNPESNEGDWTTRKQRALQAYFEWMPIREAKPGKFTSAAWRSFQFGNVATVHALETRLTGRSPSLSWSAALSGATDMPETERRVRRTMDAAKEPSRTMLGAAQEAWLESELAASTAGGATWQVLANQVVMARTKLPNMETDLSPQQKAAQDNPFVRRMIEFSQLGLPMNLDAWDGYPAARDRLYASAKRAGARLVTLTGDTHTAWANTLTDKFGSRRGVEFGCTSITSPGTGAYVKDVPDLGYRITAANPEVNWHDPNGHGYTRVDLTAERVDAVFVKVSTILEQTYTTSQTRFSTRKTSDGLTQLRQS